MDLNNIQTSTPIVYDKLIPPPSRKLWSTDSPTEQLYRNKWTKYRNSIEEKESWSELEAPKFVDLADIPDARDSYFDNLETEKFATPERTLAKKLPGVDSENNNIVEFLSNCTLSSIKKCDDDKKNNKNQLLLESSILVFNLIDDSSSSLGKSSDTTIKTNVNDKINIEVSKPFDDCAQQNSTENERSSCAIDAKKNRSNSSTSCTIVEPFSFEKREKCNQEHRRARRERDSMGKEIWKGFRANPVPKFLKLREKNRLPVTTRADDKKKKIGSVALEKLNNAAQIWKKKVSEPSHPNKKASIAPKSPQLYTAIRARERQRFEEQIREKERERLAAQKIEEAARKKREEEEIAKLRKQLVHKAQPIRRYKMIVPRVEKRPLAEPMSPITHKRRRKI